ncbi:MAG: mechanosensitive ion channel [Myxococcales bacterium]|nr:mechanosensitive ion channel [Myxococcales bacterium]
MNGEDASNILKFIRFSGVPAALLVLGVMWFAASLVGRFVDQLGSRFTQWRLLIQQVGTLLRFGLYIAAIAIAGALSLRLSDQAMLALSGTIAVTAGFAFKDLGASVLAGVTILLDRPFQVGDRVRFGDHYGEITAIGLRSVRLTTLDDNLITIPNNKFLTEVVACGNAGALDMLIQMDFFIGVDQDVVRARQIVSDAITSSRYAFLDKPWAVLVNQLVHQGYFAVRLRAKVYVLDLHFEKALETDVTLRVLDGFRAADIKPPAMLVRTRDGDDLTGDELPVRLLHGAS